VSRGGSQTVVLIADPLYLVSDALARALQVHPDLSIVGEHPLTALQTLDMVDLFRPHVLLMEYWMEELLAPAIIQVISKKVPHCKVILLSWLHGNREILNALRAGAAGFLPKSVGVDKVVDAIRRSQAGESPVFRKELDEMLKNLERKDEHAARLWENFKRLTRRELQILALISSGRSLKDIASTLSIAPRTARNYLDNMMNKTGAQSQVELLAMAKECGLIGG